MSKSVSVLVTNRNTDEAIQLCVESVGAKTKRRHQLIVYDDASTNRFEVDYLRGAQEIGWLRLIEGEKHIGHGQALNILVNEVCDTDYAVILDSDVQVTSRCWMEHLLELFDAPDIAAVAETHGPVKRGGHGPTRQVWLAPFSEFWFGAINMAAYRDGLVTDWQPRSIYDRAKMRMLWNAKRLAIDNIENYVMDVGCQLYHKVRSDPRGKYRFVERLPEHVKSSYVHYRQVSSLAAETRDDLVDHRSELRAMIHAELKKLRGEP